MLAPYYPWWVALIVIFIFIGVVYVGILIYLKRWERRRNERDALQTAAYFAKVHAAREKLERAKLRRRKEDEAAGQHIMDKAEEARRDFE